MDSQQRETKTKLLHEQFLTDNTNHAGWISQMRDANKGEKGWRWERNSRCRSAVEGGRRSLLRRRRPIEGSAARWYDVGRSPGGGRGRDWDDWTRLFFLLFPWESTGPKDRDIIFGFFFLFPITTVCRVFLKKTQVFQLLKIITPRQIIRILVL